MRILLAAGLLTALVVGSVALYRTGAIRFNSPDSKIFPVIGIDVSHHQGEIDWPEVAASGVAFAFIKSTEGADFSDPRFSGNWEQSRAAEIPRGAYHFFTFCSPGASQAAHFLRVVPPTDDALAPVADVEFVGNCRSFGDLEDVRSELRIFLETVESAWGRKPILYLTRESLERVIGSELTGYPVWIRSVFSEPALDEYRGWVLWQFSDNSRVPGISGLVDQNALRPYVSLDVLVRP